MAAVAVQKPFLQSAVWWTIRLALILTAGLSVLSLLFATAMARSITGSIEELRLRASALLKGADSTPPPGPPELGELWQALKQSAADRDRSEQALRESEAKLRLALDAAELGTWRWETGMGTPEMQWDPRCMALFGLPPATRVTYEVWANSILPEDKDRAEANVARALDPADPQDETFCEYRVRHADGTVHRLSSIGRVFFKPDPASALGRRAVFMAGVIRDVTAVHLAKERIRESEERLRLANEAAGIGTFTIDLEAGRARYSPELAAMLGFPAVQTAKIEEAFKRVHRDDLSRVRAQFEAGLSRAGAGPIKADFRFVRPGGEVRWMTWAGRVHFCEGQSGRVPFRIDGACVDITGRMRAEEAVRASEARFRGVFKHAGTGIAIKDLEGRFQSCNPALPTRALDLQRQRKGTSMASRSNTLRTAVGLAGKK